MTVRPWVLFDSDLPYDGIEDGADFIQWPGKTVAEVIAEILAGFGYKDLYIDVLGHAGYEITFNVGKRQLGVRVTVIDTYTVNIHQYSWMGGIFNRQRPEYLEVLERLNTELAKDGRFHNIRWFTDDEVLTEVEGARSPLEPQVSRHPDEAFDPRPQNKSPNRRSTKVRPRVKFRTDVRGRDGGAHERLGYSVTLAISQMLARRGCRAIRTFYRDGVGWIIDFRAGKRRLVARINWLDRQAGEYQLVIRQRSCIARTLGLSPPEYIETLRRLCTELDKDSRFHDARWFFEREIHFGADGVLSPVED